MAVQSRQITCHKLDCGSIPATGSIAAFQGASGVEEYHLMLRPTQHASVAEQLDWLSEAYRIALSSIGIGSETCVLRRVFCSDLTNQAAALEASPIASPRGDDTCAISLVGQPPAPPARVAIWAYHISDPRNALGKTQSGPLSALSVRRGDLTHIWATGITYTDQHGSYDQTNGIFGKYQTCLDSHDLSLAEHVIRTWFFVRDVDANYQGLVTARREVFKERGLTPDTHFIASTGIEGTSADVVATVTMDAYAIAGVQREQIRFLSAPDHLSPTYIYGVTFERGVSVDYADRKHISISGTASIDSEGKIVHPGDIRLQIDHTMENVEALLADAGAGLQDACSFIVYVRDVSDLELAGRVIRERLGDAPVQVVVAPVCRPGWLVEVECQAIIPASNPNLPPF